MNSGSDATPPPSREAGRNEVNVVLLLASILSVASFWYCYQHNLLLLYGDAVAHLHIARRIFDSLNPGFRQLGSVWLPLPHLLLLPFVQKMDWWQSGVAGAVPSMLCYVLGSAGIYKLARLWIGIPAAAIAVLIYALNPGLLYLQTTAMTEPLFLAEMIWAAVLTAKVCLALQQKQKSRGFKNINSAVAASAVIEDEAEMARVSRYLLLDACVLVAAIYTRYDGWIYASLAWLIVAVAFFRAAAWRHRAGGAFVLFTAMIAVAPALWLAYNAKQFGDPLDFIRGPYSARAIEQRTAAPGSAHYPGYHSLYVASLHFLKAAEMGVVPFNFGNWLLSLAAVGAIVAAWRHRCIAAALLLWMPLPFYAYSIAYGSVPIFIPVWWPHSWYNTRYGMEMLPAFALSLALLVDWLRALISAPRTLNRPSRTLNPALRLRLTAALFVTATVLIILASITVVIARPLVLQEAFANSKSRIPFEHALAHALQSLPPGDRVLMYTSAHVGALQQAAIPLRRTINEGDYLQYEAAIKQPARAAPWVVAIDGDAVADAVARHPESLLLDQVICSTGQPCARVYRSELYR